jgi:phosphate transport system substrate-binding protein
MKHFQHRTTTLAALLCSALIAGPAAAETKIVGSGASFPAPIYAKWFKDFSGKSGTQVDYQSKGSGGGIQDFIDETVDFAASDAAMSDEEIAQVKRGAVLLPMTAGEVVLTYNLNGVKELKLPRDVYPDIFLGKVTHWNDPRIAAANPGVKLPDNSITVVVRSDSSGTSFVFTGHLAAISPDFKGAVGQSKSPNWPAAAKIVKSPKNDGVTATVKQTPGAIGYIEYGYAKITKAPAALLQNKAGNYIAPGEESGKAALASAEFPSGNLPGSDVPDLRVWVDDPAGAQAYPIASFTWMLLYKDQDDGKARILRDLIDYGLDEGQKSADALGYIPLPENVKKKVHDVAQMVK